jgi:hypothetical protein
MRALVLGFKREDWDKKGTKAKIEIWNPHEVPYKAIEEYKKLEIERKDLMLFVFSSLDL